MKPTIHIDERAPGWNQLRRALESLQRGESYAKVGLLGDKAAAQEHEGDRLTNVELAVIHEFGTENLPERSFVRRSFDEHRDEYLEQLTPLVAGIYTGQTTARQVLEIMGMRMKTDMKALIRDNLVAPPDAPATVARKAAKGAGAGSPVTLLDSAALVTAIDHAVVLGGEEQKGAEVGSATIVEEP